MKSQRPIYGILSVVTPFVAILTIVAGEIFTKQFLFFRFLAV